MNPICIVDDQPLICSTVANILEDEGYQALAFADAESFWQRLDSMEPALVMLDIWLPGTDGLQLLQRLHERFPELPVIMMSGHAGIEAAVAAIKFGAADFMEKPLHLEVLLDKVKSVLNQQPVRIDASLPPDARRAGEAREMQPIPGAVELVESPEPQRTLKENVVLNGVGLLSGRKTGIILSPLGVDEGIVFQTLDGQTIRGHITSLRNYHQPAEAKTFSANSTTLDNGRHQVRTVEHLMAVLSMFGITNALIKVGDEVPNIDGSAKDFCELITQAGITEQPATTRIAVILQKIGFGPEGKHEKHLYAEPFDGFEIAMRVDYPPPIGEQLLTFNPTQKSFAEEIAPARSFNTFENIDMAQKLGTVGSGYLNSHIIMHDGKVINTALRYDDEFVRHKILDMIGDLSLLGYPIRGRITANMTSHGYNHALVERLYQALKNTAAED
ncbi:UDP-3-O-acyl-N-acetylglucosamine deacetylase [Desulfofustis glycolicus]|uniref:UDP-3-O-acyl-N-acetylglucosamine deacetylase n=1 Tax=Desulfofustis glycolicus DSM 9705 TaxID=1121409 RepID=A0A1M5X5J4_9BACT|nr:UDP-3-O-acyl-N-acetylglucosamine deacetylase [Desulfofustis glycolicus]MCB2216095.1 UDP-3-O-acyl-N-acetylglucosamine deacetylase [Desulfobulbaceae bacterium]SHH94828.1 UDP-3-O-[3-hydroxymyristoyl] N-acetylglucosamine deacetylase [Desulfofustis glycolicus DSM 9705]